MVAYRLPCLDEDAVGWPHAERPNLGFALDGLADLLGLAGDSHREVLT